MLSRNEGTIKFISWEKMRKKMHKEIKLFREKPEKL